MTNFIPADKLKEEIKRQIKVEIEECHKSKHPQFFKFGRVNAIENLIPFINFLQQEQPKVDLEKELTSYYNEHFSPCENGVLISEESGRELDCNDYESIARHFAEWQKQRMMNDVFIDDYIVHDGRIEVEGDPLPSVDPIILLPYPKFKPNDKVKIIIVKDDQQ